MNKFYSYLIRTASESVAEIAERLYPVAGSGPVDSAASIYAEMEEYAGTVIYRTLDFERFKDEDGCFVNYLAEEMTIDKITDEVSAVYGDYIARLDMADIIASAESSVLVRLEQHVWRYGFLPLSNAISLMLNNLQDTSEQYARLQVQADRKAAEKSYAEARRCTVTEKMARTNTDDILVYRQDMIEYLEQVCDNMRYAFWERFFNILSCSSIFVDAQERINEFIEQLVSMDDGSRAEDEYSLPDACRNVKDLIFMDMSSDIHDALLRASEIA